MTHDAVNKCLAYGGHKIGTITLTACPYLEKIADMPEADLIREGDMVGTVDEFIDKYFEGDRQKIVTVIRFKFSPIVLEKPKQLNLLDLSYATH